MIGPHEGQELELMLQGRKPLAFFHDVLPINGIIPEEVIPESAFATYVASGEILRNHRDIKTRKGDIIRVVCFSVPSESWRMDTIFWIKEQVYQGCLFPNFVDDIFIGRLLGYSDNDVREFVSRSCL